MVGEMAMRTMVAMGVAVEMQFNISHLIVILKS